MDRYELLAVLEEGLANGRISPQTAAYIAAEIMGVEAFETGYHEWDFSSLLGPHEAVATLAATAD